MRLVATDVALDCVCVCAPQSADMLWCVAGHLTGHSLLPSGTGQYFVITVSGYQYG
jgi:hypothetical protein